MTKEIVRELVNGDWVTGVRDASSGGGGGGMFPNGAVDASWDGSPVTALDGQLVSVDANGGAVTVTLPSDPPQGSVVGVQLVTDPNGNTVTVDGNGDAIQGSSTYDLPSLAQYETALFTYATGITEAWTVFVKPTAGGGSQTVRRVIFPFTFATPNLLTGVVIATLADGETLLVTSHINVAGTPTLYIPTAWDGTTPTGLLLADNRTDPPYGFGDTQDMTLADSVTIGTGNDLYVTGNYAAALAASNGSLQARGGPIDLLFQVDDGSGGDPGAAQGIGQIVMEILTA